MAKAKNALSRSADRPAKQRGRKLKVFRTPIGFHDAYVAAPSMKAALEAWGADSNLFAQGIAEAVTEPRLMKAALAQPGQVVRVARGTAAEHVKAVGKRAKNRPAAASRSTGPDEPSGGRSAAGRSPPTAREEKRPKPDRAEVDVAEEALRELDRAYRAELREIDRAMAALERQRRQAERRHDVDREEAVTRRDRAKRAYQRAMTAWRG